MSKLDLKSAAFLLFMFVFCLPGLVSANIAAPTIGGTAGAEPNGLEKIHILHETLTVDLRGLAKGIKKDPYQILVKAEYEIENRGAEENLELVFVFGSLYKDFHVYLDDVEIASHDYSEPTAKMSRNWEIPGKTPWTGGESFDYEARKYEMKNRGFSLKIPAGRHRLRAEYRSMPSSYASTPTSYRQFAYILAPAKDWASFGGLELTVYTPDDFTVVTQPELEREGAILKGRFDNIPADAFVLTARYNVPKSYKTAQTLSFFLLLAVLAGFPVLMVIYAAWRGFRQKLFWLWGIGLSILWSVLILAAGWLSIWGATYLIPDGLYSEYGYESALGIFAVLVLAFAAFPAGLLLWFLTVWITGKYRKPKN